MTVAPIKTRLHAGTASAAATLRHRAHGMPADPARHVLRRVAARERDESARAIASDGSEPPSQGTRREGRGGKCFELRRPGGLEPGSYRVRRRPRAGATAFLLGSVLLAGAEGPQAAGRAAGAEEGPAAGDAPFVRVLGTAQDGGFPHVACDCSRCQRARREPGARRRIASLALVVPNTGIYLIDATPDLREQLDALADVRNLEPGRVDRSPVDGVLLTHAHIGHYLGLAFFGFEAVHTHDLPAFCTPRMAAFLRTNGPWDQLVRLGNVALREVAPGESLPLAAGIRVTPIRVPHRDEYSDTVGYRIEGPSRRLLYVPDTDSWRAWDRPPTEVLADMDIALLDGTFFSLDELPGRDVATIGHPLIRDTMDLLGERVTSGHLEVFFTHLNHSNPALEPESAARAEIERRGFHVLADGQEFQL